MKFFRTWKKRAKELRLQIVALCLAYKDPATPWYAKAWGAVVVAYALSPIDLIPDFIPVLGHLDDLVLLPLGIALAVKLIPRDVMARCRQQSRESAGNGRPVNWITGGVILAAWILVLGALVRKALFP